MEKTVKNLIAIVLVVVISLCYGTAAAQTYPTKPIRLIIPFPPGGSNDIVGRLIGAQLTERLGKQVVAENHGGAGGVLGTEIAAKSAPDGYTLLIISAAFAINPSLYKVPFDPEKSFVPVSKLGTGPNVLTIHPSLPANSLKDLLAFAKKQPGKLNFAAAGVGDLARRQPSAMLKFMAGRIEA